MMVWQHLFGTKAAFAGGSLVAIAGRRALWPAFFIGSAFSGAAWFGSFELVWSASKFAMPIPDEPDSSAQATGLMTLPLTTGGTVWLGWRGTPSLAPLPASVIDMSGLLRYAASSGPVLKHMGIVGASSATIAALTCRVVQYRGGA